MSTLVGQTWLNGNLVFYNIQDGTPILVIDTTDNTIKANLETDNIYGINYLSLKTNPTQIPTETGSIYWDDQDKTLSVIMEDTDVHLQLGQEMYIRGVNKTGGALANGTLVYISGAQGNRPQIAKADADSYSASQATIGMVTHTINVNEYGYVTTEGLVRGLNTSTLNEGDCLYLSSNAGEYTKTAPTDSKARIRIGIVVKSHVNDGWIFVCIKEDKYMFGDVDNGNYSYFESDGTFVSKGNAITYRDEYVGGPYFVPSGANAPDEVNVTIGGVITRKYAFDGVNTIEKLGSSFEIAHDIALDAINNANESLEVHIHFGASDAVTTGDVRWIFDWCLIKANGAPIAGTQGTCIKTISAGQQYNNLLCGANLTIPEGGIGVGDLIEFTLTRDYSNAADTYAADAIFYKVALHVPCDTNGSRQRYIK